MNHLSQSVDGSSDDQSLYSQSTNLSDFVRTRPGEPIAVRINSLRASGRPPSTDSSWQDDISNSQVVMTNTFANSRISTSKKKKSKRQAAKRAPSNTTPNNTSHESSSSAPCAAPPVEHSMASSVPQLHPDGVTSPTLPAASSRGSSSSPSSAAPPVVSEPSPAVLRAGSPSPQNTPTPNLNVSQSRAHAAPSLDRSADRPVLALARGSSVDSLGGPHTADNSPDCELRSSLLPPTGDLRSSSAANPSGRQSRSSSLAADAAGPRVGSSAHRDLMARRVEDARQLSVSVAPPDNDSAPGMIASSSKQAIDPQSLLKPPGPISPSGGSIPKTPNSFLAHRKSVDMTPSELKHIRTDAPEEQKRRSCSDVTLINPHGTFRKTWDLIMILALFYSAFSVPFRVGFNVPPITFTAKFIEYFIDALFWTDIILTFRTYVFVKGEAVKDAKWLARRYMKFWFWVDFVSVFPFDQIGELSGAPVDVLSTLNVTLGDVREPPTSVRLLELLRMVRMLRLFRLSKLARLFKRWEAHFYINGGLQRSAKFAALITFIAHVLACCWFFSAHLHQYSDITWVHNYYNQNHDMSSHPKDWHLTKDTYNRWNWYFASLYWAITTITTVGYGDIVPYNDLERLFSAVAMLTGAFSYGYVIGNMAVLAEHFNPVEKELSDKMEMVNSYMVNRHLERDLRFNIREFYQHTFRQKRLLLRDDMILNELPTRLRAVVMTYMLQQNVPIFHNCSGEFLSQWTLMLRVEVIPPEHFVIEEYSIGTSMFIIIRGSVHIVKHDKIVGALSVGKFFGEIALLSETHERTASVQCVEMCEVYVVDLEAFDALSTSNPQIFAAISCAAQDRFASDRLLNKNRLKSYEKVLRAAHIPRRQLESGTPTPRFAHSPPDSSGFGCPPVPSPGQAPSRDSARAYNEGVLKGTELRQQLSSQLAVEIAKQVTEEVVTKVDEMNRHLSSSHQHKLLDDDDTMYDSAGEEGLAFSSAHLQKKLDHEFEVLDDRVQQLENISDNVRDVLTDTVATWDIRFEQLHATIAAQQQQLQTLTETQVQLVSILSDSVLSGLTNTTQAAASPPPLPASDWLPRACAVPKVDFLP